MMWIYTHVNIKIRTGGHWACTSLSCSVYCVLQTMFDNYANNGAFFICRKMNCFMVQDLLRFAKTLQHKLRQHNSIMRKLRPSFTLIGSVAKGTRKGIGNELDLTVELEGFKSRLFKCMTKIRSISLQQKTFQIG
jgi:hypothetical protein